MEKFDYKKYAEDMRRCAGDKNCTDNHGNIICSAELWEQIASIIEEIPSADVAEVKHGEWVVKEFPISKGKKFSCSCCGYSEYRGSEWDISWGTYRYCPNCGAKMDGGKDESR